MAPLLIGINRRSGGGEEKGVKAAERDKEVGNARQHVIAFRLRNVSTEEGGRKRQNEIRNWGARVSTPSLFVLGMCHVKSAVCG